MKIDINDLYELVLTDYYDDNTTAISLHVSYLSSKSVNKKSKSTFKNKTRFQSIEYELLENRNLESYRLFFIKITESTNEEINLFKNLAKMDISGISDILYNILDIIEYNDSIVSNIELFKTFESDITDINFFSGKIIDNIKNKR